MEAGGGWLGWCVRVDDISPVEERLGRPAVEGNRHRPDGVELRWRQLGIKGLMSDPQLPYYVQWEDESLHPSVGASTSVTIEGLQIAGDPERVKEWLGLPRGPDRLVGHRLHVRRPARHARPARRDVPDP